MLQVMVQFSVTECVLGWICVCIAQKHFWSVGSIRQYFVIG